MLYSHLVRQKASGDAHQELVGLGGVLVQPDAETARAQLGGMPRVHDFNVAPVGAIVENFLVVDESDEAILAYPDFTTVAPVAFHAKLSGGRIFIGLLAAHFTQAAKDVAPAFHHPLEALALGADEQKVDGGAGRGELPDHIVFLGQVQGGFQHTFGRAKQVIFLKDENGLGRLLLGQDGGKHVDGSIFSKGVCPPDAKEGKNN